MEFQQFDADYIHRLKSGDPYVEHHFVSYFSELMTIKLRTRLRSSEVIEDIKQETFARFFRALRAQNGLHHPERLGAFINSICNNVMFEYFRNAARSQSTEQHEQDPPDRLIDLEGDLISAERTRKVRAALEELAPRDRQLLQTIFLEEKDKDEVCRQFGVDRDYLRVLLHRAKAHLRQRLRRSASGGL